MRSISIKEVGLIISTTTFPLDLPGFFGALDRERYGRLSWPNPREDEPFPFTIEETRE